ncbi:hypothetical protein Cgig2_001409 [Carnegiea gigantea]|uniref:Cytochrome P450 n=1 Tax=Carnegiea gigantea TaxID=171969 RepID=A0A9Q1KUF5_9CARY|nr:hypothetical protein Cgig2_001409 [Carnegiea gigantea]
MFRRHKIAPVGTNTIKNQGYSYRLKDVLERFAFDNVCKLAFNVDPGCLAGDGSGECEFMQAFEEATTLTLERFMYVLPFLWKVKKFLCIGSEKRLRESIKIVHDFANNIIRLRLEDKSSKNYQDLLSRFISSYDINDVDFLRDVVVNVILAGRDTTSSGLSWFFWLLSLNPNVVSKIRSEVDQIRKRAGKQVGDNFDFDDLKEMNYLHGAISESLRLYPPVPANLMVCLEDDVLPDRTQVKKDWLIGYHTYTMGRMESIWGKDCLEFRPERWLDENGLFKPESPFRLPVFHAGPRTCLGKEMAYIQMKSIVACVVEEFDLDVLGKQTRPEPLLSITLRIKGGLHVKVKALNTNQCCGYP